MNPSANLYSRNRLSCYPIMYHLIEESQVPDTTNNLSSAFSYSVYKSACLLPKPATGKMSDPCHMHPGYGSETWFNRHKTHLGIECLCVEESVEDDGRAQRPNL